MKQLDLNLLATAIVKRHDEGYTPAQIARAVQKLTKIRTSAEVITFFLLYKGKIKINNYTETDKQDMIDCYYKKNMSKASIIKKYNTTYFELNKILTQSVEYKNSLRKEKNDGC